MTAAFNAIPEPAERRAPALAALADCNARLLRHCANLRRLPLYLGECGSDAQARAVAADLLAFFDTVLPRHQALLEQSLVPALIESMAGSDAVCLHQLGAGLARAHAELQAQWLALRPALLEVAAGDSTLLEARPVESFIACCQASAARAGDELLPMAQRLLGDDQLEALPRR